MPDDEDPPCWGVCGPGTSALTSPDAGAKAHDPDDAELAMLRGFAGESEDVESC